MFRVLTLAVLVFFSSFIATETPQLTPQPVQKITFPSKDELIVTADLYMIKDTLPYMILCHQAGYSRAEYAETAGKFCHLGYNCIAVDARSGNEVNGVKNETAILAAQKNKPTSYIDSENDIIATIEYAYMKSGKKVVLVGSSYSASLALKIAVENKKICAVMAFSPGEYFGKNLKLKDEIKTLSVPVFVTSSKEEAQDVTTLMSDVKSKIKNQFIPTSKGKHGSSCLWKDNPGYNEYWFAIMMFVKQLN